MWAAASAGRASKPIAQAIASDAVRHPIPFCLRVPVIRGLRTAANLATPAAARAGSGEHARAAVIAYRNAVIDLMGNPAKPYKSFAELPVFG